MKYIMKKVFDENGSYVGDRTKSAIRFTEIPIENQILNNNGRFYWSTATNHPRHLDIVKYNGDVFLSKKGIIFRIIKVID